MKTEYNKGGSFKKYVDKMAQKDGISPEEVMRKVVTREYFNSLRERVNKDEPETAGRTDQAENIKCDC